MNKYTTWEETELVSEYIRSRFIALHETASKFHTPIQLTELKYLRLLSIQVHEVKIDLTIKKMDYSSKQKFTMSE